MLIWVGAAHGLRMLVLGSFLIYNAIRDYEENCSKAKIDRIAGIRP